jgi:hypothetical protein
MLPRDLPQIVIANGAIAIEHHSGLAPRNGPDYPQGGVFPARKGQFWYLSKPVLWTPGWSLSDKIDRAISALPLR